MSRKTQKNVAIVAAAISVIASFAQADIAPGTVSNPIEYTISTTGATALGALTRGASTNSSNNPTGEQNGLWRLGQNSLTIGRSTYTFGAASPIQQYLGYRSLTSPLSGENTVRDSDRLKYIYHETGSINGILELVKSNGLFIGQPAAVPDVPSVSAPLWVMGWKQINASQFVTDAAGTTAGSAGGYSPVSQPTARVAYSDVRSFQAFAAPGVGNANARPRDIAGGADDTVGYGQGSAAFNPATGNSGTNFQKLANRTSIQGETAVPTESHLRNETLAVVPFTVAANPGTGLSRVTESDVKWLNSTGRLANGANFNSVTREIGSGTRNQGANNVNLDPSWAGGERDRRSLAAVNVPDVDANGIPVTIRPGDEMNPNKDLFGVDSSLASSEQPKEHRIGQSMRFSDKNSGGSGVRPTVVNNRMALGILSTGDVGDRGRFAPTGLLPSAANTDPLRVLQISWQEQAGELNGDSATGNEYTQPTAQNVTEGRYQMWSEAQAITVVGATGTAGALGTLATDTAARSIFQDTQDNGDPTGVHRKWLDNILGSVSTFGSATTNITPADAVIAASFIPKQIMKSTKEFDGGIQSVRALNAVDPDGAGPLRSEQDLFNALVTPSGTPSGTLKANLNWINPEDVNNDGTLGDSFNGNIAGSQVTYKIFANDVSNTSSVPTKAIVVTSRTVLAGDMDGNGVRDIKDVEEMAAAYKASNTQGTIVGNGSIANLSGTLSSDDLIVLTDFDGSGNIAGTNAAPTYTAVERKDVRFFLYGATVDTNTYVDDNGFTQVRGETPADILDRRRDGVRLGQLRKNEAVERFNAEITTLGGPASLKFDRFDVNNDGVVNRLDAKMVNDNVGKRFTLLDDVLGTPDDLVSVELTDSPDGLISHVAAFEANDMYGAGRYFATDKSTSDMKEIADLLVADGKLYKGDTDFSGQTDFADLGTLLSNYELAGSKIWSDGDFTFDGVVNFDDLGELLASYDLPATPLALDVSLYSLDSQAVDALSSAGFAVIPEPASLSLLGLAGATVLRRRRR